MRIAIVDLGTNTFNLLIAELNYDDEIKHLFETKLAVKLGEGGITKNFIGQEPFRRGVSIMKIHKQTIDNYKVDKVFAYATSAIREASNGEDFIKLVSEETGIEIERISGDKEAEFIYYGVKKAVEMNGETSLIMDIGGGSTEFIIANNNQIFWKQSFLLGASRLLEMFKPADPIALEQIQELNDFFSEELKPLIDAIKKYPVTELIGSSGSFESLASMIVHKFHTANILDGKTEFTFDFNEWTMIYKEIIKSNREERIKMKGLIKMRIDLIVISTILIKYILNKTSPNKMRLSMYSLKEGVLEEIINDKI